MFPYFPFLFVSVFLTNIFYFQLRRVEFRIQQINAMNCMLFKYLVTEVVLNVHGAYFTQPSSSCPT